MSDYSFLLERARRAAGVVSQLEASLARNPGDLSLRVNLASATRLAERAERDLYEVAAAEQVDICRYRLVRHAIGGYGLQNLSRSLEAFQETISYVYAAVAGSGPVKPRGKLGKNDKADSELLFGYTYAGSLGVVLLAPSERTLFANRFDNVVATIGEVFDIRDPDGLRDAARKLGTPTIRRIYAWAEANHEAGYDIDLRWTDCNHLESGRYLEAGQFGRLADLISVTSEVEHASASVSGTLVGFDSVLKTFHFVEPNKESYKGRLGDGFPTFRDWTVNKRYRATIRSETTTKFSTEEQTTRHTLASLEPLEA